MMQFYNTFLLEFILTAGFMFMNAYKKHMPSIYPKYKHLQNMVK